MDTVLEEQHVWKGVYSVYDTKAKYYFRPLIFRNKGEALRSFSDAANDLKTEIGLHPEDFVFYEIGRWSETAGVFENVPPTCLGKAIEFVRNRQDKNPETV